MSSAGQVVGGIVGGIIGFFAGGNVMLGISIGMAVGGAIDPPKGPKIEGPRLNDLAVQTATLGAFIPRLYGTIAIFGNIFYLENNQLKETKTEEEQGGKGGGGAEVTTYSYSATFALGLCEGPIAGIGRIWIGGKLVYDPSSPDAATALANALFSSHFLSIENVPNTPRFTIYKGTDTQEPDPRMQASLGIANTPAFRGLAYIMFEDLELEEYGNSLMGAQIKVEVFKHASDTRVEEIIHSIPSIPYGRYCNIGWWDGITSYEVRNIWTGGGTIQTYYVTKCNDNEVDEYLGEYIFNGPGLVYKSFFPVTYCPTVPAVGGYEHRVSPTEKWATFYDMRTGGKIAELRTGTTESPETTYCSAITADGIPYVATYNRIYYGSGISPVIIDSLPFQPWWTCSDSTNLYFTENTASNTVINFMIVNRTTFAVTTVSTTRYPGSSPVNYPVACPAPDGGVYICGMGGPNNSAIYKYDGVSISYYCYSLFTGTSSIGIQSSFTAVGDMFFLCMPKGYNQTNLVANFNRTSATSATLSNIIQTECLASGILQIGDINTSEIVQDVRGYKISNIGSLRSAIEPLQAAWPFDVVQTGYTITFRDRGGTSVQNIIEADLGTSGSTDSETTKLGISREMEVQLPRKVSISYIDSTREYDIGSGPGAERLNTLAVNHINIELAVVLNAEEAAQVEERLLYMYWLERTVLIFTLPPTYNKLEPADIVTIQTSYGSYEVRLTEVNLKNVGLVECTGRLNNSAVYTSTATAQEAIYTGKPLTYIGNTHLELIDGPSIIDAYTTVPGFGAAMRGYTIGWPGATLVRTDDIGQTWKTIGASLASTFVATVVNIIPEGTTTLLDKKNVLIINPIGGSLSSITETEMFAGGNHFAYGAHGRWEIIAAQNCILQGDGTYYLSDLMRGRFGTEHAINSHTTSDRVIKIDINSSLFISTNIESVGYERTFRAVTNGTPLALSYDKNFTYNGENLKPLSPVLPGASKDASGNWNFKWVRRGRVDSSWRDYVDVPIGETSEAYEVEIYSDITYIVLKRTITGLTTASATYSAADQTTDFGSTISTVAVKIYQISSTIGRGRPLVVNIQVPGL